jgi:transposase-like protein
MSEVRMPKKYDDEFKTRAVRLVTDYAEEYDTRTACVAAVAKRLGVAPETLRRWINQTEVDAGVRHGGAHRHRTGEPGAQTQEPRA